jgi:hypothetical protein
MYFSNSLRGWHFIHKSGAYSLSVLYTDQFFKVFPDYLKTSSLIKICNRMAERKLVNRLP